MVHCKLFDEEEGCLSMEDDHRPPGGEIGQQGYEFSGLEGASFCGREDLLGSSFAARRCGVDFEGLGCQDESKLLMRKALFSVERGKTSLLDSARQGGWRKSRQVQQLLSSPSQRPRGVQ